MKRITAIIISVTMAFWGSFMLTSCETTSQNYTLNFVTTPMKSSDDIAHVPYNITFDETIFSSSPSEFSPTLAKTAMVLSSGAYDSDFTQLNLDALGFTHKAKFNYSSSYAPQAVGISIAKREIANTTIVAIVLRGTYKKEWHSNFDIGRNLSETNVHEGFFKASNFALKKLSQYMSNYMVNDNECKFFVTGHSRAGAVANLMSKTLIDTYTADKVYAYTFASPNTTTALNANIELYRGIFNFVNPDDFISYVPLSNWGFTKYGTTIEFFSSEEERKNKLSRVNEKYKAYRNRELKISDKETLSLFLDSAYEIAPTVKDYYDTKYDVLGIQMSMYDYMNMVAQIINEENVISNGLIILGSDATVFKDIKDFLLIGMDDFSRTTTPDFDNSLISYTHSAETYLSYLEVYIEDM